MLLHVLVVNLLPAILVGYVKFRITKDPGLGVVAGFLVLAALFVYTFGNMPAH